jgi:sugar phosphate isomerase/epimerase
VASISIGLAQYRAKGKLSLESRKEYIRRKAVNYVKKCINVASKFTPTPIVYVCTIEPCPRSEDREDLIKKFIEALTLCVDYAEKMEVNLALEHFPGTLVNNTKMLLQIDEMIPSKNLKFLLDVGHMKITKENFVEAVRNMKNKLIHVHVHNNDGVQDLHLPPYKGKITPSELKDFIIELKNINYIGYISIELPEMPEPKKILSKSKVFLKNLISQAY